MILPILRKEEKTTCRKIQIILDFAAPLKEITVTLYLLRFTLKTVPPATATATIAQNI